MTLSRIDHTFLDHAPPRSLPSWLIADLIGDQLMERSVRSYFDPLFVSGLMAAVALILLRAPVWLSWLVALLMAVRLGAIAWSVLGPALEEMRLLRYGLIVEARILRVRRCRDPRGDLCGAYLDCELPISQHRTSVGSVWLPDAQEAMRLTDIGHVPVLCLPQLPGTWRLLEDNDAENDQWLKVNSARLSQSQQDGNADDADQAG